MGALSGLRIVDLGWAMAGPQATRILADLGAEVIKVESNARPDQARTTFGPHVGERGINNSGYFNNFNRNKLSATINLSLPEGREVFKKLVAISDGVLENFSAGVMKKWGLHYEGLRAVKPDIVYVSMAGFGHSGPYADYQTYGPTVQAVSGLTFQSGFPDMAPAGWGFSYMDHTGGYFGCMAMLQALLYRRRTGKGQHVDLSQVEAAITLTGPALLDYQVNGRPSARIGNASGHPTMAPHGVYRCAPDESDGGVGDDEWVAIAVATEGQWQAFTCAVGHPEWQHDPRFETFTARLAHQRELDGLVEEWTRPRSNLEVQRTLQAAGVPAGRVQRSRELFEDEPQLEHRRFYPVLDHPVVGRHRVDGMPAVFSRTPAEFKRGGPLMGEDNDYVFGELLGMPEDEIRRLESEKVLW
ncbi:MAG TPA: CoA transferase [Dehalococcoidia bacterium]|nr:CoA transferase [Dehalococcoidia bacterium]